MQISGNEASIKVKNAMPPPQKRPWTSNIYKRRVLVKRPTNEEIYQQRLMMYQTLSPPEYHNQHWAI